MSGIFRDVFLWSAPKVQVRDFEVKTVLDGNYQDAVARGAGGDPKQFGSGGELLPGARTARCPGRRLSLPRVAPATVAAGQTATVSFSVPVKSPRKWTAETPDLYPLLLTVERALTNQVLEVIPSRRRLPKGRDQGRTTC